MLKCKTPGCHTRLAEGNVANHGPYCRSRCNRQGPVKAELAEPTRKSTQDLLDDYDNRIKALQAGRANVQRTMDELPVEVCPKELARLQRRDTQLSLIEYEARHCIRQPDPGVDIAGRFVLWLQQSNILRGQRF